LYIGYGFSIYKMTNWKARAVAVDPPIPDELLANVVSALETLEAAFQTLVSQVPLDELPWSGPEDDA
jgi:hypothetical protein